MFLSSGCKSETIQMSIPEYESMAIALSDVEVVENFLLQ